MDNMIDNFNNLKLDENLMLLFITKCYECCNIQNNKNNGIKNEFNNFEKYIENILFDMFDNDISQEKYFIKQPNGSQKPPDFKIFYKNIILQIECKSSKQLKPVWNCSIPDKNILYLFYCSKINKVIIFFGNELINDIEKEKIINFHNKIKQISYEFNINEMKNSNFEYYPRQMINQKYNFDINKRDFYFNNTIKKINIMFN